MLKNKVVVVTGGAGLIGQEFVKAVVEQNGIADINEEVGNLSKELNIDFVSLQKNH
jgi:NAD(P)-dependent dehydrogenase (short-subunit alcohol dehydrogenase family)